MFSFQNHKRCSRGGDGEQHQRGQWDGGQPEEYGNWHEHWD